MVSAPDRLPVRWTAALLCLVVLSGTGASAGVTAPSDRDLHDEVRVRRLAESFRCLVCQNQSLADSNAELAADLRDKIGEQVRQGATDAQVQAYMVRRYGDFVLYRPPLKRVTWPLWFWPFAVLAGGAGVLLGTILRRRGLPVRGLNEDERRRMEAWLAAHEEGPRR
jgi:cytochrome c-type biogenesis protein CcmH